MEHVCTVSCVAVTRQYARVPVVFIGLFVHCSYSSLGTCIQSFYSLCLLSSLNAAVTPLYVCIIIDMFFTRPPSFFT